MKITKDMRDRYVRNNDALRKLNGNILKSVRQDVRNYGKQQIAQVIKDNKCLKVL